VTSGFGCTSGSAIEGLPRRNKSETLPWSTMQPKTCTVTVTDVRGSRHSVEILAESLFGKFDETPFLAGTVLKLQCIPRRIECP
jgi:hypothetical protein